MSLFLIAVIGIALFGGPESSDSIVLSDSSERIETQKSLTKKTEAFLTHHPQILNKGIETIAPPSESPRTEEVMELSLQGETIRFRNQDDLNRWVYEKTKLAPFELLEHLEKGVDPDLKLELLQRIIEIEPSPELIEKATESAIREGAVHFRSPDERSQQLAQKYFNFYLQNESDSDKGKKRIDSILNPQ